MKSIACNAVLLLAIFKCCGQTNFVVTTNWVTASSEFREVNGQLYNTEKSAKFVSLQGKCVKVMTNGVLMQQTSVRPVYETVRNPVNPNDPARYGNFIGGGGRPLYSKRKIRDEEIAGEIIFLEHYPSAVHKGSTMSCRAILGGHFQSGGETFEAYDYGLPHVVPVLVTNRTSIKTEE